MSGDSYIMVGKTIVTIFNLIKLENKYNFK